MTADPTDRTMECVVCGTVSGPEAGHCPGCREPRTRWCDCLTLVGLDQRECPSCGRVIRRVVDPAKRRRVRLRRRLAVAGLAAAVLGGAALLVAPRVSESRRLSALWTEGEEALGDGRFGIAAAALAEVHRSVGDEPRLLRELGEAHLGLRQHEAARAALERSLVVEPGHPRTQFVLGKLCAAQGDLGAALDHLRESRIPEAQALEARLLASLGQTAAAAAVFDRVLEGRLDPSGGWPRTEPRDDLALGLEAADVHRRLGSLDFAGAAAHARRAGELAAAVVRTARGRLDARRDDPEASAAIALAATGHDGTLPDAEVTEVAREALRLAPSRTDVRTSFARWLARRGARDQAAAVLLQEFPAADPRAWRIERAITLAACGDVERAVTVLLAARADADPAAAPALARVLLDAGRPAEARRVAEEALRTSPVADARLREIAGAAAAAEGDLPTAVEQYRAWADLEPSSPEPLRRIVALGIGTLAARRRAREGPAAEEHTTLDRTTLTALDRLEALDPEDAIALRSRAEIADADGRDDVAEESLRRLLAAHPEDSAGRALRIRRACEGGSARAAAFTAEIDTGRRSDVETFCVHGIANGHALLVLTVLREAIERAPEDAALRLHRARALLAAGRPADAAAAIAGGGAAVRAAPGAAGLLATALVLAGRADEAAAVAAAGGRDAEEAATALALADRDPALPDLPSLADRTPGDLVRVATLLDDLGRGEAALRAWSAAESELPADPRVAALRAASLLEGDPSDEHRRAAYRISDRLRQNPLAPAERALVAALLVAEASGPRDACDPAARAVAAAPRFVEARAILGRMLLRAGDPERAAAALRVVVRERPESLRARRDLVESLLAMASRRLQSGDLAGAREACDEATRIWPPAPGAAKGELGAVALAVPKGFEAAARSLAAARPGEVGGRLILAVALAAEGRREDAETSLAHAITAQPELPLPRLVRAAARADAGSLDDALADLDAASSRSAPASGVLTIRARALFVAGRTEEALAAARGAVSRDPRDALARRVLAAILLARGQEGEAAAEMLAAHEFLSEGAGPAPPDLVVEAARRLLARGRAAEALRALDRVGRGLDDAEALRVEASLRR